MKKRICAIMVAAVLLLAALPALAATGDLNYIPVRDILSRTDYGYFDKISDGSFQQLYLDGTQMQVDPIMGVYCVGDYGDQLVRPAYFRIQHLDPTAEAQVMDNDYVMMYVNVYMKNLLEYQGYEYLNADILNTYNSRMGYTGQAKDILYTINVAQYCDDIVDINCFGIMSAASQNADNSEDQIINDEVYAIMRQKFDTVDGLREDCWLITDQDDVYTIIDTLREGGIVEPDFWAMGWLKRHAQ